MTEQEYINATSLAAVTNAANILNESSVKMTPIDPKEIQEVLMKLRAWQEQLYKSIRIRD
jgi:DNA-binding ferritin-like protein